MIARFLNTKNSISETRTTLALLLAPWAAPIVVVGEEIVEDLVRGRQIAYYYSYPWEILTAAFTGYIGLFVIGIPLVRVLRRYSRLNLLFLTAYGGIAGAVVFVFFIGIFSWSLGSQPHFDGILKLLAMLLLGGVLGASVAAAYGLIAGMPFTTKPDGKAIEHTANADSEDKVL